MVTRLPEIVPQRTHRAHVYVVRDDMYPGGTKARVLHALLVREAEYVYASPTWGYAQVALARTCERMGGRQATVFVPSRNTWSPMTKEAASLGAKVMPVKPGYLNVCQARAREYSLQFDSDRILLPFGMKNQDFILRLAMLARDLQVEPREIWCVVGSGTLAQALALAWPGVPLYGVRVGAEPPRNLPLSHLYAAPERFERPALEPPPFPSNPYYDAKAWRFVSKHAEDGALFWNVSA